MIERRSFREGAVYAITHALQEEKDRQRRELLDDARRSGRLVEYKRALIAIDGRGDEAEAWAKTIATWDEEPREKSKPPTLVDPLAFRAGVASGIELYGQVKRPRVVGGT